MDEDLLVLIKSINSVESLDELREVKELGNTVLRKKKRQALLTLMSISEELGKEEILRSIRDLEEVVGSALAKE